ncbi:SEC-C metal-binding domain-containing protein [Stagnimonas aquatica]|uniref:SEC-C metal-binding domain-containing protein n=1 Tax=Stagnimonas aquatica TaxID=2689987 RepID=UPI0018F77DEE|nr:SEC-C metal-binding domain-containing protein [Stagnimonas aquatica]
MTDTERMLADYCERSFLKLWSYPNPYKDDGHELCDLLAVFGNHVFILFDRHKRLAAQDGKDPQLLWERWRREVVDKQIATAHGAERYIRSGRAIFVDGKRTSPFPVQFDPATMIVHKIVVAHGAAEACQSASDQNIFGSLAITYEDDPEPSDNAFHVRLDRQKPVHVFDSHNLPIIFGELDTVADLSSYLDAKLEAIKKYQALVYCGEEDLLAHYLLNFDAKTNRHIIGTSGGDFDSVMIGEGEWRDFASSETYRRTKLANNASYLWDELIQRTCQNSIDGTLEGNADLLGQRNAIVEMAKEPRYMRRALAEDIVRSMRNFPEHQEGLVRNLSLMPASNKGQAYLFLQIKVPEDIRAEPQYRQGRQHMLEVACAGAKLKFYDLKQVVGIAIDAPKYTQQNSEDFLLMDFATWTDETRQQYEPLVAEFGFFRSTSLQESRRTVSEFVNAPKKSPVGAGRKQGRNEPCACGSGIKYKRCCMP